LRAPPRASTRGMRARRALLTRDSPGLRSGSPFLASMGCGRSGHSTRATTRYSLSPRRDLRPSTRRRSWCRERSAFQGVMKHSARALPPSWRCGLDCQADAIDVHATISAHGTYSQLRRQVGGCPWCAQPQGNSQKQSGNPCPRPDGAGDNFVLRIHRYLIKRCSSHVRVPSHIEAVQRGSRSAPRLCAVCARLGMLTISTGTVYCTLQSWRAHSRAPYLPPLRPWRESWQREYPSTCRPSECRVRLSTV
jgi:hypothetical protein